MLPLFDMLANAQNGHAIETLARQFNLSHQQAQTALEALLPAFSQGLKRNASDPYGLATFMNTMASGQYAKYFEDAARATAPEGVADGNGVLDQIFGSKELSRAVAAQAAEATGIGQEILRQMLPVIASMIMGGLFKQATGQMPQAGMPTDNPFARMIEQMMRQGGAAQQRQAPTPQNPFDSPFGKMLEEMFGGGSTRKPQQPPSGNPYGDNPLGKMFEEMMRGGQAQPPSEQEPAPRVNPSGRPRNPYDDLFGEMFETGRRQREEYQKQVESIFDSYLKGMEKHR